MSAGLPLHIRRYMGVGIQGEAGIGVAQDAGEGLGIHAAGQGVGGESVPQVVEADLRKARFLQESVSSSSRRRWAAPASPAPSGSGKIHWLTACFFRSFSRLDRAGRQADGAPAPLSLGLADLQHPAPWARSPTG